MNKKDIKRNFWMLKGSLAKKGYDWWWHSFTGVEEKTGKERTFFIEYFTINPVLAKVNGGEEPILGQEPFNRERKFMPSHVMVKCGWWGKDAVQLNKFLPWKDVKIENDKDKGFSVSSGDFFCSEEMLTGSVEISQEDAENHPEWMCGSGSMTWNLTVEKDIAFNVGYGASAFFRATNAFEMYWHAQGMKTRYSGTVIANGKKYQITKINSFGYADKNWGKNFTSPWVWLSSNDLTSKITNKKLDNSVFDIGGGKPKLFGISFDKKLLSEFYYEGKSYEFNFSKFWTLCRTKFNCSQTDKQVVWKVRQETLRYVMETEITCNKDEMLFINYESPDGEKRHKNLFNGGTGEGTVKLYRKGIKLENKLPKKNLILIDEIEAKHVGCEFGEY